MEYVMNYLSPLKHLGAEEETGHEKNKRNATNCSSFKFAESTIEEL